MSEQVDYSNLEQLVTVADVAEMFDVEPRIVRREAKKGAIPGTVMVLGKYGFDPELVTGWSPPEAGTRVAAREDGRRRYRIFLSAEEAGTLKAQGYEIVDLREAGRARRAARKAGKAASAAPAAAPAAAAADTRDPFADFGVA